MSSLDKNKRLAFVSTLLVHLLLILALFFMALRTPLPLPGEEGVEVNLGYSDQGMGYESMSDPFSAAAAVPAQSSATPQQHEEETLTSIEEAPSLPDQPKPKENLRSQEAEMDRRPQLPDREATATAEPQQTVNQRALYKGSSASSTGEGISGEPGDQGKPDGLREVTRYDGQGGRGNGPSYNLGGRGSKNLVVPRSSFREQGNVVVDIWVDRKGRVQRAEVNLRGTTILDANLRNIAVQAAKTSLFAEDPNAAELQKGNIIYTFVIGN